MLECIRTNMICSEKDKKCKVCKLDSCKEVMQMLNIQEKHTNKELEERLIKNLPEPCKKCPFLEVLDLRRQKVKCFYLVKNECLKGEF